MAENTETSPPLLAERLNTRKTNQKDDKNPSEPSSQELKAYSHNVSQNKLYMPSHVLKQWNFQIMQSLSNKIYNKIKS